MRIFFLAFVAFILSGLFLLPLLGEPFVLPDSYLIFAPLALMVLTLFIQIDGALTYKKLLRGQKYEHEHERLMEEHKELTAKFHLEKKAVTGLRSQVAMQEKEIRALTKIRSGLTNDLSMTTAEKVSLQTAFQDALKKQQASEEQMAALKNKVQSSTKDVVHLLTLLQEKGRFVDFIQDDITKYPDAQIGAAARVVHQGCAQVIGDYFEIAPVAAEGEGSRISVSEGHNPQEYRFLGRVAQPPFQGTVLHRGWCTKKVNLPQLLDDETLPMPDGAQVITPAEIEVT